MRGQDHRPRILLISHVAPHPPNTGGRQRMNLLYHALRQKAEVDLLLFSQTGSLRDVAAGLPHLRESFGLLEAVFPEQEASLARSGAQPAIRPWWMRRTAQVWRFLQTERPNRAMTAAFQRAITRQQYDLVVSFHLGNAWMCGALEHSRVVVDADDLVHESFAWRKRTYPWWSPLRWALAWKERQLRSWVERTASRAWHLLVVKPEDRMIVGPEKSTWLPNIAFNGLTCLPSDETPGRIVVLGAANLGWRANADGFNRFIERVWPVLKERHPAAVLRILGGGLAEERRNRWLAVPGLELPGYVNDLADEYRKARFCIVPVFYGAGSNIKFIEAASFGRTIVASRKGCAGYEHVFTSGRHFWRCESNHEFVTACAHLLGSPEKAQLAGADAFAVATAQFSRLVFDATLHHVIEPALKGA